MSIPAQGGAIGVAPQAQRYGEDYFTYDPTILDWYRFRATNVNVGAVQMQDIMPPEVGGAIVPTGAYKTGAAFGGDCDVVPRIENVLGVLLEAGLGNRDTHIDAKLKADGTWLTIGVSGINSHVFRFNPSNSFYQPWVSVRKFVPGITAAQNYGEIGQDCKIDAIDFTVPAAGLLQAKINFRGRHPHFPTPTQVNAWAYENTYEDSTSVAVSGKGIFKIGGIKYPITGMTVRLVNNLTDLRQEMIVGSQFPDDFVALSRAVQIRCVYKWENADLYHKLYTGEVNGTEWNDLPLLHTTAGETRALDALFQSPSDIPGGTPVQPFSMRFIANRVTLMVDQSGVQLQAGNIVLVPLTITVLEPEEGDDYFSIVLENAATYTWPIAPTLTLPTALVEFPTGGPAENLDVLATVTDTDSANFDTGYLRVWFEANGTALDDLGVENIGTDPGEISIAGSAVSFGGVAFGTVDVTETGNLGVALKIVFDTDATPTAVQALVRAIQFNNPSGTPSLEQRIVRMVVADGDGGFGTATVTVKIVG